MTETAAVEAYFTEMRRVHSFGAATRELSYRDALGRLLAAVGGALKPKVFCVGELADIGAGRPDFGLFAASQMQKGEPRPGAAPERGVIEVKGLAEDGGMTADSPQVRRYFARYGLVLVTNYRTFVLIGADAAGRPARLEGFELAGNEAAFWTLAEAPKNAAKAHGASFAEYLRRALSATARVREPKELAWLLASYARDALARVEAKGDLPALRQLRTALEDALGIRFEREQGDHFFRSTLVQTLFYGVFSAWVLWAREPGGRSFDWRLASWHLRVPMIERLFERLATPSHLGALGLVEVLDWAAAALNRVDRDAFFKRFEDEAAVQYFYEPFLAAFDPKLRDDLGVWYTPEDVVRYMVGRVDSALKDDLGIPDGLADERVHVLDPCCGTGAFLVEVLRRIDESLVGRGLGALRGREVRRAATTRVHGFEIMPAPFVVAHLQIGRFLQRLQAPLGEGERARVFLTNALTGWSETAAERQSEAFPEFERERELADGVKREAPILVVLGNPPYNGYPGVAGTEEEQELIKPYRRVSPRLGERGKPEGQGLNDLYVRFFRMAERRIAATERGVVAFIANYSWLDGRSHPGMREHLLRAFDAIQIDCLNGDRFKTGKLTPDGRPDPSIFSTERNKEGIQVGTAIATFVRRGAGTEDAAVGFRHLWGQGKWRELAETAETPPERLYEAVTPISELGLPFRPGVAYPNYFKWSTLLELFPSFFSGVQTKRDEFLVACDKNILERRIQDYFDKTIEHDDLKRIYPEYSKLTSRYNPKTIRDYLLKRGMLSNHIVKYYYRPFDIRWIYWEPETKLLGEKSPSYWPQIFDQNIWIEIRQRQAEEKFTRGLATSLLADNLGNGFSSYFPLFLREAYLRNNDKFVEVRPNLTRSALNYLHKLIGEPIGLFRHTVVVLHAPSYRDDNATALRMDWPRLPLPNAAATLTASAALGAELIRLLEPETDAPGVTSGALRPELAVVAVPTKLGPGGLDDADLALAANWGYRDARGAVMAGAGRAVERPYTEDERAALAWGTAAQGLDPEQALDLLGRTTLDVHLNDRAFWANVPAKVWAYRLGGYQVLKKWLSYREAKVLGRPLRFEEAWYFARVARRIAAILLMGPRLDANYRAVRDDAFDWSSLK